MWDESATILNAESQNQLNKQYDDLLKESLKLLLLKKLLLEAKELSGDNENFAFAIKIFRAREFLSVENDNLLHLDERYRNVNLSYIAQRDLQKLLWQNMQRRFHSIEQLVRQLQRDFPQLLNKKQTLDTSMTLISTDSAELLSLDLERRQCLQKLAEISNRKLKLMKAAAEIKLDSAIIEKLEALHLSLCINQVKTNIFRDHMINEFVHTTEHTVKAIKFVEKHIDVRINKEGGDALHQQGDNKKRII